MQSIADGRRCRIDRALGELTPGQRAAHRRRQALAARNWQPAAAGYRIALGPDHLVAQRRRLVIDRAGVALQAKAGPGIAGGEALAKRVERAAAGILQRLNLAHGFAHVVERGFGFLAIAKMRCDDKSDEHEDRFLPHTLPPRFGSLGLTDDRWLTLGNPGFFAADLNRYSSEFPVTSRPRSRSWVSLATANRTPRGLLGGDGYIKTHSPPLSPVSSQLVGRHARRRAIRDGISMNTCRGATRPPKRVVSTCLWDRRQRGEWDFEWPH